MTYNCCGLRMKKRALQGRRVTGGWGTGTDLRARPEDKTRRILTKLREGNAEIAILTDVHVAGDEADALMGYVRGEGWGAAITEGYVEVGHRSTRGGVVMVWDTSKWKVANARAEEVVMAGRILSVTLKSIAHEVTTRVVGVYAPCREAGGTERSGGSGQVGHTQRAQAKATARQVEDQENNMWDDLENDTAGDGWAIVAGDMNAEMSDHDKRYQEDGMAGIILGWG